MHVNDSARRMSKGIIGDGNKNLKFNKIKKKIPRNFRYLRGRKIA